jgi:hypothetical protein
MPPSSNPPRLALNETQLLWRLGDLALDLDEPLLQRSVAHHFAGGLLIRGYLHGISFDAERLLGPSMLIQRTLRVFLGHAGPQASYARVGRSRLTGRQCPRSWEALSA